MILIVKHAENEGPGTIEDFFRNTARDLRTIELGKKEGLPKTLDDIEAVILMGGPMNVYEEDKYPFLKEEDAFLKKVLSEEKPFLGICLGAQLLAKAGGGEVKKAPKKEIGWYDVDLTKAGSADPLFKGLPQRLSVFQWHEDTFEVPKGGALLAESKTCKNQAFRLGKNAYGLQFHIEVTADMIGSWMGNNYKSGIKPDFQKQANLIYLNFSGLI